MRVPKQFTRVVYVYVFFPPSLRLPVKAFSRLPETSSGRTVWPWQCRVTKHSVCVYVCCLTAEEKTRKKKAVKKIRLLVVRDVGWAGGITRERGGRAAHAATPAEELSLRRFRLLFFQRRNVSGHRKRQGVIEPDNCFSRDRFERRRSVTGH